MIYAQAGAKIGENWVGERVVHFFFRAAFSTAIFASLMKEYFSGNTPLLTSCAILDKSAIILFR